MSKRTQHRACEVCQAKFWTDHHARRFCGETCRKKAANRRQYDKVRKGAK